MKFSSSDTINTTVDTTKKAAEDAKAQAVKAAEEAKEKARLAAEAAKEEAKRAASKFNLQLSLQALKSTENNSFVEIYSYNWN